MRGREREREREREKEREREREREGKKGETEFRQLGLIKSRKRYSESSSISNNLMKRQSFRASRGRGGGGTSLRQGLKSRTVQ